MELRNLHAFVEVVRQGGFSAAAAVLHATQPTVSKAVRQLEHECRATLLDRRATPPRLTDAGEVVHRRAVAMLAERESLLVELDELRGVKRGRLRLGLPTLGISELFAPRVAAYRRAYPGVEIELLEGGSRRLEAAVRAGEIELGASLRPVPDEFAWQPVCDEPLMVLLPEAHALAGRKRVKLAELASSPFVLFEGRFVLNSLIAEACARRGFTPTATARGSQPDFVIALVAAGLGLALLPKLVVESRTLPSVKVALLDETDLRWQLGMIWRREAVLSTAARSWLELLGKRKQAPEATG
ncbi:LysR family transcriptional regulator [Opitutaceae bacterium TAV5]|nr:LysR family transcriptional regulator [Opitutaceae bacterium TAV5]